MLKFVIKKFAVLADCNVEICFFEGGINIHFYPPLEYRFATILSSRDRNKFRSAETNFQTPYFYISCPIIRKLFENTATR